MSQKTYRAVFFDLDGTLLPMDIEPFLKSYFQLIASFAAKQGVDAELFMKGFKSGIKAMSSHDRSMTNADAYWDAYERVAGDSREKLIDLLETFYSTDFNKAGEGVEPNPSANRAVETLRGKGYSLALTTMPMFPPTAVASRLRWAGIDSSLFDRLTTYDNSTSVKPKLAYFAENLAAMGLRGEDVLMVGNNTVEDLAAMGLGCDAYVVTDFLLDDIDFDLSSVKHGTMDQFAEWVDSLPPCDAPATQIETGRVAAAATDEAMKANLQPGALRSEEEASRIAADAAMSGVSKASRP